MLPSNNHKSKANSYLIQFLLITSCFALWGFANDITNPMVKSFSKIFRMSVTPGSLVPIFFVVLTYSLFNT